jgi:hypothetical protein
VASSPALRRGRARGGDADVAEPFAQLDDRLVDGGDGVPPGYDVQDDATGGAVHYGHRPFQRRDRGVRGGGEQ